MHIFIFIFLSLINIPQPTEKIDNNKKVTDNTRGWFIQETGIGQAILDIFFIDSLNGWAVEKYGKIIHTSDGGYSWERQYCREQRRLYTIGFRNNSEGWAGGSKSEYGFDFYVLLLHTIDAGSTWIELKSNNPPLYNWIKDISIPNTTCGYYLQCFYYFCEVSSSIYNIVTGNCEISWWIPEAMCGEKIHFIDSLCGWYLSTAFRGDSQCYLFSTQTGPENLNLIDSFSISIKNIFFVDSLKGWIVGESGTILHTEDAGTTWVTQLSGINNTLNGIDFVDSLNGWIVGEGGVILRTRDGGEHWTTESSPVNSTLHQVCFTDTSHGWVAGSGGVVLCYSPHVGLQELLNNMILQIYPNPFNILTSIKYTLKKDSKVTLRIYNVLGQEIKVLLDTFKHSGFHQVVWDGRDDSDIAVPAGVYFLKFDTGEYTTTKKLLKVR